VQSLTLIRGLPGSGKSTLAKKLCLDSDTVHFEADMYFINDSGTYIFDASKIKDAHDWCQHGVRKSLDKGYSVVVSNTFVKLWEMKYYISLSNELNIPLQVIICKGTFNNVHNVPLIKIEQMEKNWES